MKIKIANEIKKQWDKHNTYLNTKNLKKVCRESVMFYEGNHYYNKNLNSIVDLPKVVFNVIKMIIDNKVANVLSTPFSVNFSSSKDVDLVEKINRFDKYILKELNHDIVNRRLVQDGEVKGTFACHYYWNENIIGEVGLFKGGLQVEILDPLNIAVANPRITDIQKQKYIIIPTRMEVKAVKKMCDSDVDKDLIKADDNQTDYINDVELENEQDDSGLVTVYTRYFRVDGEVYFERATEKTLIHSPRALNPNISNEARFYEKNKTSEENKEIIDMDSVIEANDNELTEKDYNEKFYLYPIELGVLTPSDKCIYGLSDVSPLIMSQKMLNIFFATIYKKSMDDVFPKWFAKKGALQQEITGLPNEVITDYSNINGWGIHKVDGSSMANGQFALGETITEFMKSVSNSRDVLQGDAIGANMSALAIQSLQTQAEKPIAQQRELFMLSYANMAKIRLLFYKFYYQEKDFAYEMEDVDYENEVEKNPDIKINRYKEETFKGEEIINTTFAITIDVGRGTKYDALTAQETINNLFLNGAISNLSSDHLEQYYELLDRNLFPQKDVLKRIVKKQRESEKAMLQQEVEALKMQNQEYELQLEQAQVLIETLQKEFTDKINISNERIKQAEDNYKSANDTIYKLYNNLNGNSTDK